MKVVDSNILGVLSKMSIGIGLILLGYLVAIVYFLSNYFIVDANIYVGLLLAPYILIMKKEEYSYKYIVPLLIFLGILFIIPTKTFLFLVLLFGILFLLESCIGRTNNLFLFLLLILSPIFKYFSNFFGFPIRLWLSDITGSLLKFTGEKVAVMGNIIMIDGSEFSVDPGCVGLQMMTVSFIIAILIMAFYQRKTRKQSSFFLVLTFLIMTFALNIICNLLRIVALVLFKIMPGNIFHDVIGILCLFLYVILPLFGIAKFFFSNGYSVEAHFKSYRYHSSSRFAVNLVIVAILLYGGSRTNTFSIKSKRDNKYSMNGFKKEVLETGITKFENTNALIYLKPLDFYSAEHNPMICWSGSGYEFKSINKEKLVNIEIYTGIMEKGQDRIYTAWWFDNGMYATINQFEWRWRAVKGDPVFYLVNISAVSKEELIKEMKILLSKNDFFFAKTALVSSSIANQYNKTESFVYGTIEPSVSYKKQNLF